MFKALLVQRFYNLSDEQTEYQINDRLSFQQFIGWTADGLSGWRPDATGTPCGSSGGPCV
jgi:hypothetical protein